MGSRRRPVSTMLWRGHVERRRSPISREMAVRILGRDCRENGNVEYTKPEAKQPPPRFGASRNLGSAGRRPRCGRPPRADSGVAQPADRQGRRRLAEAGRGVGRPGPLVSRGPGAGAREARKRVSVDALRRHALFGDLDLEQAGNDGNVALPPYFPVDRNEAFIAAGTPDLPVSAVSKYLGLAWRLHRPRSCRCSNAFSPTCETPSCSRPPTTSSSE